jgi:hypothetical protein
MTGALTINDTGSTQLSLNRSHSSTTSQESRLSIGNSKANGTAGSNYGSIRMFGKSTNYVAFQATNATGNRTIELPDKSGTLALADDLGNQIEYSNFSGTNTGKRITFSGNAHTRVANLILIPSGQAAIGEIIAVGFSGGSGYKAIESVFVSPNDYGVTASGLSITIPRGISQWGVHTMIKLYPKDELTYTIEDV